MTATTNLDSASVPRRSSELHQLAVQLYELISSGHDALAFNVDENGPALTVVDKEGRRHPVWQGSAERPPWQRAKELRDGQEVDRRFNPWVMEQHLRGRYSVAPAAPGWVQWVWLDIDAHPAPGSPELVARRLARAQADRVLAGVWRALNCSAERHPLITRSPGLGYHVGLPLTRGASSSNPEHTWPAAWARSWVERHLVAAGLELKDGVLEVYPSGRHLRAPCGRGTVLLQATRPDDPDALGLVPWPGTMAEQQRVDWRGERAELSTPVRRVVPMVRAFLAQWQAQRRTLADWLGRPAAAWDPTWGFLSWRDDAAAIELAGAEKEGEIVTGEDRRSQESDDERGCHGAAGTEPPRAGRGFAGRSKRGLGSPRPVIKESLPPSSSEVDLPPDFAGIAVVRDRVSGEGGRAYVRAEIPASSTSAAAVEHDVDLPPDPAGAKLVRGRAFSVKIRRLLLAGVTEARTRHDAVLSLAFYWFATCGLTIEQTLALLEAWCRKHPHEGSRLAHRPRAFIATCLREARHYIEHYSKGWFRGNGAAVLASLSTADHAVIDAVDPQVAIEVFVILAWLASHAGADGRIAHPVQIASGLLARLCGDRRIIDEDGKRRRATARALVELERIGVLTMASNYRVGQRGRTWSCWYQFGSGTLPRPISLPAAEWAELEQTTMVAKLPTLAIAAPIEPLPDAASAPIVEARVVGERLVREGLIRVLSDGTRGAPRTLVTLAPNVERPTVTPAARLPWFVREYRMQTFTPGRLWSPDPVMGIAFPDVEARRRMSRNERLAWGAWGNGGGDCAGGRVAGTSDTSGATPLAPVIALPLRAGESSSPVVPTAPSAPSVPAAPCAPIAGPAAVAPGCADAAAPAPDRVPSEEHMRAELAAELGAAAAAAVPSDLVADVWRAWGGFLRQARGP